MAHNLYIGNLSYDVTNEDLEEVFAKVGEVESAKVILDRDTSKSRGFGFVEMSDNVVIDALIEEMDGSDFKGRPLVVRKAREKNDRERSSAGGPNNKGYRGK